MDWSVDRILSQAVEQRASDVHFTVGLAPQLRIDGEWSSLGNSPLSRAECEATARELLGEKRMEEFLANMECDVSYSISRVGRFRVNAFRQRGSVGVAVRVLPYTVPDFEELGLPRDMMHRFCGEPNGIVLICGPTGSGKSTTLARMVCYINEMQKRHIVTIEDPIEFLHPHVQSIVEQREVGTDTASFAEAMRRVLRQSPDVVLVGEIRDPETVRAALMIAETGHLVFSTIHTGEVTQALSRTIDIFPSDRQSEIRVSLSLVLRGMVVQQLLPGLRERRRVLAYELMVANAAIRNLIREGKFQQVYSQIQIGYEQGMCTMNSSLVALCCRGEISPELALAKSPNPKEFRALMERGNRAAI